MLWYPIHLQWTYKSIIPYSDPTTILFRIYILVYSVHASRVRDKKRAHIVGTQIKAYLMETRYTSQGEIIPSYQTPLELEPPGLLLWPLTLVHRITPASPLYDLCAQDLLTKKYVMLKWFFPRLLTKGC